MGEKMLRRTPCAARDLDVFMNTVLSTVGCGGARKEEASRRLEDSKLRGDFREAREVTLVLKTGE